MSQNSASGLSSASTLAQIEACYDDNASYQEDGSVSECRSFLTACRMLLRRYSAEAQKAGSGNRLRMDENLRQLEQQISEAKAWLASATAAGNDVVYPNFQTLRG